ncbi:hypothetical protein HKX54_06880 [Sulfitobacter sp. M57]|uniref:hypothetical protein n=1 Tax=unclassified Sulfitobacter TaxID=196795 RepID=UPI0023E1F272|nr:MULTISPECIES: hypothetical protein [unclassified Sulfitobacter]MDF3414174.1 hypothetical protein [Sulfitobacter sp. KE5]MDF3420545.1 hypothetical protein [Sulfitobacter sp. KE43]MDF3432720.1 hypothetical protein [Sulfitobacter sp. KE42]MDF3458359.1 hypothetical protein [Sulfitobacter sp. S74]MDF3462260.1 hypothetical protein [Sulfitobacter sp. Ks18]
MAYQDFASTSTDASAVLNNEITATRNFFIRLGLKIENVVNKMAMSSTGQRRVDQVHMLQAKSDAELDKMGIKRDDIVHFVFRDLYYL